MASIYLPGQGMVDLDVARVHRAVNEYDERLSFGLNERDGNYCVFIAMPHGHDKFPVLGFGKEVPHPEDAVQRLWRTDTTRHGDKILRDINLNNERIRAEHRYQADQAGWESAERVEHALRKEGMSPVIKSYRKRSANAS